MVEEIRPFEFDWKSQISIRKFLKTEMLSYHIFNIVPHFEYSIK